MILVRSLGTADELETAPEKGADNLPDLGGTENEISVRKERNWVESQVEMEEKAMGTQEALQEKRISTIHGNMEPNVGVDFPGYRITEDDFQLDWVYGHHVHANDGTHLDEGIVDDAT